jgi:Tfp pilus assembly protein PilV
MRKKYSSSGFSLVEAVVVVAVTLLILLGLSSALNLIFKLSISNTNKVQATFLEEEGLEIIRLLRDDSWSTKIVPWATGSNFYLHFNNVIWQATTTNIYINNLFERKVVLSNVYRDGSQNIVSSGGVLDPNTKKVTVFVSWANGPATTTRSLSTYLTNVFNN